jgi:hypothetical protein
MSTTTPLITRALDYRIQSTSTASPRQLVHGRTTVWIVIAMLAAAAILATMLPPASSYGSSIATPAWVTSL